MGANGQLAGGGGTLGVDFGTSNTVAQLRWPDGRTRQLLFDGTPLLPSAVFAPPSGALSAGRDALHHGRHEPGGLEPNPKRRIDDGSVLLGERDVPVPELVGAVLSRVATEAVRVAGGPPESLVLTHPAGWGPVRRLTLADAAALAGLPAPEFVPEPVASARYFTSVLGHSVPPGHALVVYDLGAGTFDVSVIRAGLVLGSDGKDDVGGLDIDAAIVRWLRPRYDAGTWQRLTHPDTTDDRRLAHDLWSEARTAKEMLSRAPSVLIRPPLLGDEVPFTLEDFEQLATPLIDRTVRMAVGLARYCEVKAGHVLLVGGSSRIPLVATALHRAFAVAPTVTEQPETVVAEGALVTPASLRTWTWPALSPAPSVPAQRTADESETLSFAEMPTAVIPAGFGAVLAQPRKTVTPPRDPRPPGPRSPRPVSSPLRGDVERPQPPGGHRARWALLGIVALVAAMIVTAVWAGVFSSGVTESPAAAPSASAPAGFPEWPIRYRDSLDVQRNWSADTLPAENATCAFRNSRLEVGMRKAGIYRCPGQGDNLTDFALVIDVYLIAPEPCAGIWFRRGLHESGEDAAYVLKVCPDRFVLGRHHATGAIEDFGSFPIMPIAAGRPVRIGLVARGTEIVLFRDGKRIGSKIDGSYPKGRIGLGIAVDTDLGQGLVAYRNVEMRWP